MKRFLKIPLPDRDRARELFKASDDSLVVTVHGDGVIHIYVGEGFAKTIHPDGENIILKGPP